MDNLPSIAGEGLLCDTDVHRSPRLATEIGNVAIKASRRSRPVDAGPGGVVADYVPFYFGRRGPMLYQIKTGQVPSYHGGQEGLVYLCTTLQRVQELGLAWVASDRNAATAIASFTSNESELGDHVDWSLVASTSFNRTAEDPDRPKRHQAELLVHRYVPWEAIQFIGARTADDLARVRGVLGTLQGYRPRSDVRADWYF